MPRRYCAALPRARVAQAGANAVVVLLGMWDWDGSAWDSFVDVQLSEQRSSVLCACCSATIRRGSADAGAHANAQRVHDVCKRCPLRSCARCSHGDRRCWQARALYLYAAFRTTPLNQSSRVTVREQRELRFSAGSEAASACLPPPRARDCALPHEWSTIWRRSSPPAALRCWRSGSTPREKCVWRTCWTKQAAAACLTPPLRFRERVALRRVMLCPWRRARRRHRVQRPG